MREVENGRLAGASMMVAGALCFAVMALFVRLAAKTAPVGLISFVRYGFTVGLFLPLLASRRIALRPVNRPLLYARSIAAASAGLFYFLAVSQVTMAEAVILKYTFPVFAVITSALLFGERTSPFVMGILAWSFAGVYVMMDPGTVSIRAGHVWALMNAVAAGAAVAFVRRLRATDDSWTIMFYTAAAGMIVSAPLMAVTFDMPGPPGWLWMSGAGLFGMLAQFSIVYGIRFVKTGAASVIMMLEVVFASFLGLSVLGDVPTPRQLMGGGMILAGGAALTLMRRSGEETDIARLSRSGG